MKRKPEEKKIDTPEWYWDRGLHDAEIVSVDELELPHDYKQKNPARNCMVLYLNAKGAIFDTTVKEIRFYNYKILSTDILIKDRPHSWWLSDSLSKDGDKYVLTVSMLNLNSYPEEFDCIIEFEKVEVVR